MINYESVLCKITKRICRLLLICSFILILSLPAVAQQDFGKVLTTMVKIRSSIPKDARTANSLGTEHEGNGVFIGTTGHILTIGYIILEAESVEVTFSDGQTTAAVFVGYDHHSRFGLIRAVKPKAIKPVELGQF